MIAQGEADIAVCGAAEAPLYFHPMLELKLAGLAPDNPEIRKRQCRPFDLWRTTGVIGEGACVLLLEPESSPRARIRVMFADMLMLRIHLADTADGLYEAIRLAIANSGLQRSEIEASVHGARVTS